MENSARTTTRRSRRTWTDEHLAVAVRDAHSWRGVLRNLGLYPGGPNLVVKREAARLGLDTTHFGSPLHCSDAELTAALRSEESWPSLLAALGMHVHSRRGRAAVTARAAHLGLRTDHLDLARTTCDVPSERSGELTPDLAHLRRAAEPLAAAWFTLRGLWPAVPAEPRPYDLLVETPTGVRRIQVKTTTSKASPHSWFVRISRHAGGGRKHNRRVPYTAQEIDYFVVVDGDLTLYLVPLEAVAGRTSICLRQYGAFVVGSAASLVHGRPMRPGPAIEPFYRAPQGLLMADDSTMARRPASTSRARVQDSAVPGAPDCGAALEASAVQVDRTDDGRGRDKTSRNARWTAEDLRSAAELATSWADMLRAFGFKASSTKPRRALQREVRNFGIDTSHFVGQRTWSDAALVEAAASARTWAELCGMLGLSTSAKRSESVRAAAKRLGVSLECMTLGPRTGRDRIGVDLLDSPRLDRLNLAARSIASAWFQFCGLVVSASSEPAVYDLVVHFPEGLKRIQAKSTVSRDRYGSWVVRAGHRPDGSPTAADFIAYNADEVDLFFVVDGDLLLYLIPQATTAGKAALSLRAYTEFIVGDASSLLESRNPASPTIPRPEAA